jgi:hypothetical protein
MSGLGNAESSDSSTQAVSTNWCGLTPITTNDSDNVIE